MLIRTIRLHSQKKTIWVIYRVFEKCRTHINAVKIRSQLLRRATAISKVESSVEYVIVWRDSTLYNPFVQRRCSFRASWKKKNSLCFFVIRKCVKLLESQRSKVCLKSFKLCRKLFTEKSAKYTWIFFELFRWVIRPY